jgi:hypothetical protein
LSSIWSSERSGNAGSKTPIGIFLHGAVDDDEEFWPAFVWIDVEGNSAASADEMRDAAAAASTPPVAVRNCLRLGLRLFDSFSIIFLAGISES